MKGMRGLLWISVVLAALVMMIPGGITGAYAADTSGSNINWEYNSDNNVLFIDGSGSIPDYASGDATPWNAYRSSAEWISIGKNITGIGANAFAGFTNSNLRIIFNQSTQPTISSTAFSGITAVCRYFSTSWNVSGNYGGTSISWVYLPFNQFDDVYGSVYLVFKRDNNWQMCAFDEDQETMHYYSVTKAQIDEAAYARTIALDFEAIPTSTDDQAVYLVSGTTNTLLNSVSQITLSGTSSGSLSFTLNAASKLFIIELLNPNATLTINASNVTAGVYEIRSAGGSINYTGNVQHLGLQSSDSSCSVSVTGNVNEVTFYDSTSDTPFKGDLTVTGTVKKGYVRGKAAISGIPGTDSVIRPTATFENISSPNLIINDGVLQVSTTPLTPTADMYYLEYYLSNSGKQLEIGLTLYPKEDYYDTIGEEASSVSDLNITPDQIVPGSSVQLSVTSDYGQLVLNGTKDTAGNTVGFYVLGIDSGNITVNCPVELFTVNESTSSQYASNVVMNSTAQRFTISGSEGMTISLGENGKVVKGIWERGMRSPRYFDGTEGAATLFKNGTLRVLSWREGETIKSILPSNDEVSEAAGVAATVDLTESSASELTSEENQALAEFLSSNNGWKTAAVFDVSVNKVEQDEEGNEIVGDAITSLNSDVSLAVSNEADSSAFVVRLHNDNGTVSAAQLSQASTEEALEFESGLFSKYAIVSASNGLSGKCGENLTWKMDADGNLTITGTGAMYSYSLVQGATTAPWGDGVTSVTIGSGTTSIGDYAFYGCAGLKEITLPDSVTAIGEGAFAGCSNLETALIPASVTSIGKNAFASCPKLTIYCYPGSAALAYAKANSIPYVVIGEEATATPTAVPTAVPKTGDASSPALWIGLVLLGVLGVGAAVVLRRRK